jgi:tRNA A-37 threonylcarbamoyl transferase component Bud32/Tol biopolymer transport system component
MTATEQLSSALADRYRIERELGQGGMATVYLAYDLKHDRKVALKVLKPELAAVLGADRFVVEIKTTAALQHPHILPLFDSGTAGGFLYYVMPFVEGETLRDKLNRETQLSIDEAVRITREVADALDYAHRHGVIHRDIKPENILLQDGRPVVADFGIALAVSAAAGGRMTETGLSLGTPHYMSPEQATAEKDLTNRSDIYSLGSVLYEMLTGDPPHVGASAQQIIMKIVTEEAAPVTKLRRSVPPNVSAAVAKSLEKIPADRFESAKAFAEALANPTYTTLRTASDGVVGRERRWARDPRSIGLASIAAIAGVALLWALTRPPSVIGPAEYDVGLPDSATMRTTQGVGLAVAPSGEFVVYHAARGNADELWYRSLRDATARRIDGTEHGSHPAISADGSKVAFLRYRGGPEWTLETVAIQGGAPAVIGRGSGYAELAWLPDGQLQIVDGDGNSARWFDPGGGPSTKQGIAYCMMPSSLPNRTWLLCGGGGAMMARLVGVGDSGGVNALLWTGARDSSYVYGSQFRLVDGRYLVYLSMNGDLLAAPVDVAKRRAGRSVRLVSGLGRREYSGAGTFDLSSSGTLVYAQGVNHAVGNLVSADERSLDTLNVGRDAYRFFAISPDGRRLAAVVEGPEGAELRIYDLRTGEHVVYVRGRGFGLPVWSARGDRVLFSENGSLFAGSPDQSGAPELVFESRGVLEAYSWMGDDRILAENWSNPHIEAVNLTRTPPTVDTLALAATFPRVSPDGRWLSYNSSGLDALWLQPIPATGKRYQIATGAIEDSQWLSPTELTLTVLDSQPAIDRVRLDLSGPTPTFQRRRWIVMPEFVATAGQSYSLHDGRVIYLRGSPERPVQYLRVIPGWVTKMKHAVDEANH